MKPLPLAESIAWVVFITCILLLLTLPQWMPHLIDATWTPEARP